MSTPPHSESSSPWKSYEPSKGTFKPNDFSCEEVKKRLKAYANNNPPLPANEVDAIKDHLATCDGCVTLLASLSSQQQ